MSEPALKLDANPSDVIRMARSWRSMLDAGIGYCTALDEPSGLIASRKLAAGTGGLKVRLKPSGGISVDATGLYVTSPTVPFTQLLRSYPDESMSFSAAATYSYFTTTYTVPASTFGTVGDTIRVLAQCEFGNTSNDLTARANFRYQHAFGSSSCFSFNQDLWGYGQDTGTTKGKLWIESYITMTQAYTGIGTGRVRVSSMNVTNYNQNKGVGAQDFGDGRSWREANTTDFNNTIAQTLKLGIVVNSVTGAPALSTWRCYLNELTIWFLGH